MDEQRERSREPLVDQGGKREYEPPEIVSQKIFETTALACGKIPPQGGKCGQKPSAS